jgi:sulfoacetaldehyde dehydrogenase
MGCGTWGGNSFSDNLTYKNFLNITRIARPISQAVARPTEISDVDEHALFAPYFAAISGA